MDEQYVDRGWGKAVEMTDNFFLFDVSDNVQEIYKDVEYPVRIDVTAPSSLTTFFDGHAYDSILESKHAAFFKYLGLSYKPHPRKFSTPWGEWLIDFEVESYYIEIKPTEPLLEEEMRCACAATQTEFPVIILYGNMAPPFVAESKTGKYERPKIGIRGYWYQQGIGGDVKRTPVVWVERGMGKFTLQPVHVPYMDRAWDTVSLKEAYAHVNSEAPGYELHN